MLLKKREQKNSLPHRGEGKTASRYHPDLLASPGASLASAQLPPRGAGISTLWPVTEPAGATYKPDRAFSLRLRGHFQRGCGAGIAATPALWSRPLRLLVLCNVFLHTLSQA